LQWLSGTATAGNYCVLVYDSGNIQDSSPVSYVITVAHQNAVDLR
jgi:selenophosphate synthetase-related protein